VCEVARRAGHGVWTGPDRTEIRREYRLRCWSYVCDSGSFGCGSSSCLHLQGSLRSRTLPLHQFVKLGCYVLSHPSKASGHYVLQTSKFFILPTQCIYVFCLDLRINSVHFPIQHYLTGLYNRDLNLWSPVVTILPPGLTTTYSTFCPHSVFMCFVWISKQTAIISLFYINWLVFIT